MNRSAKKRKKCKKFYLAFRSPDMISHSRWMITVNRILRFYASVVLKKLLDKIMNVHIAGWFATEKE